MSDPLLALLFWTLLTIGVLSAVLTGHNLQVDRPRGASRRRRRFGRRPPRMTIPIGVAAAVVPAHDEEAVLAATLRSLLAAYHREDIFVFCDNCSDATEAIARTFLPAENVVASSRPMGKSRGIQYMLNHYILPCGYHYVTHIDADTIVEPDFLVQSLKELRYTDVACVVGQIRSRWYPKSVFSVYRVVLYLFCVSIYRELQNATGSILIASGCATTWKTKVLRQLEFDHKLSIEDISLTFQVHRKALGRVRYARSAVVWTQDPHDLGSYRRQTQRWSRGWWESLRKHSLGLRPLRLSRSAGLRLSIPDIVAAFMVADIALLLLVDTLSLIVLVGQPFHFHALWIDIGTRRQAIVLLAYQYLWMVFAALTVSLAIRSIRPLLYSPLFVPILYLDLLLFLATFISTSRRLYRRDADRAGTASIWVSPERRQEV
jgi:cellulose synthase/poly-beta-1,6-N-acetylglucosamine synthase-like glycosyltransferase